MSWLIERTILRVVYGTEEVKDSLYRFLSLKVVCETRIWRAFLMFHAVLLSFILIIQGVRASNGKNAKAETA